MLEYHLPKKMRMAETNPQEYTWLFFGRPGVGKTTLLASFPKCLLLSCERVSKGLANVYDFNSDKGGVTDWGVIRSAVRLLEKEKHSYQTTALDTVDFAYNHCMAWVCKKEGIEHPEDAAYGKGWNAVRKEFEGVLARLARVTGIVMSSHSKEVEITTVSGLKFTRIQPTMSGQAFSVVKAMTDFIFYAEYARTTEGKNVRVLVTQGNELIDAKRAVEMPDILLMPSYSQRYLAYQMLTKAFAGQITKVPDVLALRTATKSSKDALLGR